MSKEPTPQIAIGTDFDNKLELIGIDLKPDRVRPGDQVSITWYWRCKKKIAGDWKIFVHLDGQNRERENFDHHPVNGFYKFNAWKPGEIIRYDQKLNLKQSFKEGKATLYTGIYALGSSSDKRMKASSSPKNPRTADNRLKVTTITVDKSAPKTRKAPPAKRPPSAVRYRVSRVNKGPVLDGKLDDPQWKIASWTRPFKQSNGKDLMVKIRTRAKILYSDEAMYIAYETLDTDIRAEKGKDQELWTQDNVEIFIDPQRKGQNYFEFQFAPNGSTFDAKFTSHRKPAWQKAAKNFDLEGMEAKVSLEGTLNNSSDKDRRWTVEVKLPFKGLSLSGSAPERGSLWRFNMYRIDSEGTRNVRFMGTLAPVGNDFHKMDGAAELIFGPQTNIPRRPAGSIQKRSPRGKVPATPGATPKAPAPAAAPKAPAPAAAPKAAAPAAAPKAATPKSP